MLSWLSAFATMLLIGACGEPADTTPVGTNDASTTDISSQTDADLAALENDVAPDLGEPDPTQPDGTACTDDRVCLSGHCLLETDGFFEGHCGSSDCANDDGCFGDPTELACVAGVVRGDLCLARCQPQSVNPDDAAPDDVDLDNCREGYSCQALGDASVCYPHPLPPALIASCEAQAVPDGTVASRFFPTLSRYRLSFDLTETAESFAVMLYGPEDSTVLPAELVAPDGTRLDLLGEYEFFNRTATDIPSLGVVLVPAGPQWSHLVMPGEFVLEIGADSSNVCHVVVEGQLGSVLDLNLYFVGIPGLTAETAASHDDFQTMLTEFAGILDQADIELGVLRVFDIDGPLADAYSLIRAHDEADALLSLSRAPGSRIEDLLSVNVFFVRDFADDLVRTLGLSAGIPGPIGAFGAPGTGLVFSASNLGTSAGNRLVGQVLAHELGHYLGLEHTTEAVVRDDFDHLPDTPECPDIRSGLSQCPDFDNLMFPIASFRDAVVLTADQSRTLRLNPLVGADVPQVQP